MPNDFKLPDLGEGVTEGQIVRLLVAEGDVIKEDQPLMEVETDKAAVEIPSPHSGKVTKWHVAEQQVVNVGDVMVTFDGNGEAKPVAAAAAAKSAGRVASPAAAPAARRAPTGRRTAASPAIRKLARTMGIDIETITGSGPGGRVTRADLEGAGNTPVSAPAAPAAPAPPPVAPKPAATPLPAPVVEPPGNDDVDHWGPIKRHAISRARRTIAEHMSTSVSSIPHVTDSDDADVTALDAFRRGYVAEDGTNRKLTMLPFVVRAVVRALRSFPVFNARYDEQNAEIHYLRYYGIAIGVHTERGLIAPVVRHADRLTIPQIADHLAIVADKARRAAFEVNDTRGGTFTISNAGAMGGSRYSTPIINHPQVAILAIGRSRRQPWVVDGQIVPRLIMPLSLAFDHRVIDGADEVAFMKRIIGDLENPARLVL